MASSTVKQEEIPAKEMETILRQFVTVATLNTLSRKAARNKLESHYGLPLDGLKSRRDEINNILHEIVSELDPLQESDSGAPSKPPVAPEAPNSNTPPEESKDFPSSGSRKRERSANDDEEGEDDDEGEDRGKLPKSGEPPKNLKKLQQNLMSKQQFLDEAGGLSLAVGPTLRFEMAARKFKPGSCGWYWGGKVEIPCGDQMIWCQLGVNCSVLGSKEWDEKRPAKRK
eukprot:GHVS01030708.1.p1 GENE.GHVS01030708.1~~GHVS01030708.1.p1  ORF type:complete len:228 (-),score=46.73 GHVS01030708.1:579-1262(-)